MIAPGPPRLVSGGRAAALLAARAPQAGATIPANNGATESQLMAIYGWVDPKMAALYIRTANRRNLAGIAIRHVVPDQTGNKSVPLSGAVDEGGAISPENARKINGD